MVVPKNAPKYLDKIKKTNGNFRIDKKIIVLNSFTANYIFDSVISGDIYDMSKLPFRVPKNINKFAALTSIYHEQLEIATYLEPQIIIMSYNHLVGELLNFLRSEEANKPHIFNWQIFAFFREDDCLKDIKIHNVSMLDIKFNEILNMLNYPFIKKFEFPSHHNIDYRYFYGLDNSEI